MAGTIRGSRATANRSHRHADPFDSTPIVKCDMFGFGIDEADYDAMAAEAAALDSLTAGYFHA
jgi:hypothetical protein